MARPKKTEEALVNEDVAPMAEPAREKVLAKMVQLGLGIDMLGSVLSLQSKRGNELEVTPIGIKAYSEKSKRTILIPWANIRGCELLK